MDHLSPVHDLRVPLHVLLRLATRVVCSTHPHGPLRRRAPLLVPGLLAYDVVQSWLLRRGAFDSARGRAVRVLLDAVDVAVVTRGVPVLGPAAGGSLLVAEPGLVERAYEGRVPVAGLLGPMLGFAWTRRRLRQPFPGAVEFVWPAVGVAAGYLLRTVEQRQVRARRAEELVFRTLAQDEAEEAGRLAFVRFDSTGDRLLDAQQRALAFIGLANAATRSSDWSGPAKDKRRPPRPLKGGATLYAVLENHGRVRAQLLPSAAHRLLPQVGDATRGFLLDVGQVKALQQHLVAEQPAGPTEVEVVSAVARGRGMNFEIRLRAPRSVPGPPVDTLLSLPATREAWQVELVTCALLLQAVYGLTLSTADGSDVPRRTSNVVVGAALAVAGAAERHLRSSSQDAAALELLGLVPAALHAWLGTRGMRKSRSASGTPFYPGLMGLVPMALGAAYHFHDLLPRQRHALSAGVVGVVALSWACAPGPRDRAVFVTEAVWPAIAAIAGPLVRDAVRRASAQEAEELSRGTVVLARQAYEEGWWNQFRAAQGHQARLTALLLESVRSTGEDRYLTAAGQDLRLTASLLARLDAEGPGL